MSPHGGWYGDYRPVKKIGIEEEGERIRRAFGCTVADNILL